MCNVKNIESLLSNASQVIWLGRVTDFELLYELFSLSCDAGISLL